MACNVREMKIGDRLVEWTISYGDESTGWYAVTSRDERLAHQCATAEQAESEALIALGKMAVEAARS